jgi:hypothetical protein
MARLSTRSEVCPAFTGPHERMLAVIMPRGTTVVIAASATVCRSKIGFWL